LTRPTNPEALDLEQRYLDALYDLMKAEVVSHNGLMTKARQESLVQARRMLSHVQQSLLEMWMRSDSQPSTLGETEDDPSVDHDVDGDDGAEVTFDA
jgi:hypothetical protein